ncbi:MAG: PEP/pyruvate-binding domain-containing protein [Myxococcota bacterium]
MTIVSLAQARDPAVFGGKAAGLGRAVAAGLPVPVGVVVPVDLATAPDEVLAPMLDDAVRALGAALLAVRSSATIEDRPGATAAGLFVSRLDVAPGDVLAAVRACVASLRAPHVAAYLAHRGIDAAPVGMAVIVQVMVSRQIFGFAASGAPPRVEAYDGWSSDPLPASNDPALRARVPALLARAEAAVGGAAEIEWAEDDAARVWIVQLRAAAAPVPAPEFPIAFESVEDARATWRHDREHNPDPLSPAHEGLVALVARDDARVWEGYLYAREATAAREIPPEELARVWHNDIVPRFEMEILPLEAAAAHPTGGAPAIADPHARLDEAVAFLARFLPRYFAIQAAVAEARARLIAFARRHVGPEAAEEVLGVVAGISTRTIERDQDLWKLGRAAIKVPGLGAYLADPSRPAAPSEAMADWFAELRGFLDRHGAFAPVWDIAAPTFGENPRPLYPALLALARADVSPEERCAHAAAHAAERQRALREALAEPERPELDAVSALARRNLAIAEEDDLLFARALRAVRRPLLAIGQALARSLAIAAPSDVFFLPLDHVRALVGDVARARTPAGDLRALATIGRGEHARRRALVPPTHVRGVARQGALVIERRHPPPSGAVLRGFGIGGRARGPARVVRELAALPTDVRGAVLVVPAVLPQMTFLLAQAAAVVADHGGLLDHGAVQAREYGLAAVIGARDATRVLRDGEELIVDGTVGAVYRVG